MRPLRFSYLEESGAAVAGEDAVVLSRGVVGADLARDVVENPTCKSKYQIDITYFIFKKKIYY